MGLEEYLYSMVIQILFCLLSVFFSMGDEDGFLNSIPCFAIYFGNKKYNTIWKMPSVLLSDYLAADLAGKFFLFFVMDKLRRPRYFPIGHPYNWNCFLFDCI